MMACSGVPAHGHALPRGYVLRCESDYKLSERLRPPKREEGSMISMDHIRLPLKELEVYEREVKKCSGLAGRGRDVFGESCYRGEESAAEDELRARP